MCKEKIVIIISHSNVFEDLVTRKLGIRDKKIEEVIVY